MDYQKLREDYSDYLILFKTGCFYALWDNDALILNYIYQLKLVNMYERWKVVFPVNSQEFYFNEFEARGLSYIVLERDIIVEKFTAKENNYFKYLKFLMEFKNNTQKIQPEILLDPYDSDAVPREEDLSVPNVAYGKNSDAYVPPEETLEGYNQKLYHETLLDDAALEKTQNGFDEQKAAQKSDALQSDKAETKKPIELAEEKKIEPQVAEKAAAPQTVLAEETKPIEKAAQLSEEKAESPKKPKPKPKRVVIAPKTIIKPAPVKSDLDLAQKEAENARKEAEAEAAAAKKQLEIDKRKLDTVKDLYAKLISLDYMTSLVSEELKRLLKELTNSFPEFLEK